MPLDKDVSISAPSAPETSVRQTGPCVMVIFGASGDLTTRKLVPALYNLAKNNMLSREFAVVGVARNEMTTEQFRQSMSDQLQTFATSKVDPDLREWLVRRLYYVTGEFKDPATYSKLAQTLTASDKNYNTPGTSFVYL